MIPFRQYSSYYDLLNAEKDYASEVEFVLGVLARYDSHPAEILELGCGTGGHAIELAARGISVLGADISQDMVTLAKETAAKQDSGVSEKLSFVQANITELSLERQFDVALSLFHVMSYQARNEELHAALETAYRHLRPGGLFLFDYWYGPAVLNLKPEQRRKTVKNDLLEIRRDANPVLDLSASTVEVNYDFEVIEASSGRREIFKESHLMRYLFETEILYLSQSIGFELCETSQWLSTNKPDSNSWSAFSVLKK